MRPKCWNDSIVSTAYVPKPAHPQTAAPRLTARAPMYLTFAPCVFSSRAASTGFATVTRRCTGRSSSPPRASRARCAPTPTRVSRRISSPTTLLVLYRVPDGAWVRHLIARARTLGRATVFAVDDLIFDPVLREPPPVRRLDDAARRLWHEGVERYRRTLLACDAFLATSEPLAAAGRAAAKPTYLHRCGLGERELALGGRRGRGTPPVRQPSTARVFQRHRDARRRSRDDRAGLAVAARTRRRARARGRRIRHGSRDARAADVPHRALAARSLARAAGPHRRRRREPRAAGVERCFRRRQRRGEVSRGGGRRCTDRGESDRSVSTRNPRRRDRAPRRRHRARGRQRSRASSATSSRRVRLGAAARADVAARFAPAVQGRELRAALEDVAARLAGAAAARGAGAAGSRVDAGDDELALARRFPGEIARAAREPDALPDHAATPATVDTARSETASSSRSASARAAPAWRASTSIRSATGSRSITCSRCACCATTAASPRPRRCQPRCSGPRLGGARARTRAGFRRSLVRARAARPRHRPAERALLRGRGGGRVGMTRDTRSTVRPRAHRSRSAPLPRTVPPPTAAPAAHDPPPRRLPRPDGAAHGRHGDSLGRDRACARA